MTSIKRGHSSKAVLRTTKPTKRNIHTENSNIPRPKISPILEKYQPLQKSIQPIPSKSEFCEIPDISQTKFLDIKRWQCVGRPQFHASCGITSIVACWNYLFSNIGQGKLPFITVPEALKALGFNQEIKKIKFFEIAINSNILKWFRKLCEYYGVKGEARMYWKKAMSEGENGIESDQILDSYIKDIRNPKKAFIYHCYKHYLTPIGYEISSKNPENCYSIPKNINTEENDYQMLIGDSSKGYPCIHSIKWEDIEKDITCDNRYLYNIRQLYKGIQRNKDNVNYHRLILLESL